jgi:hypothetical protein
VLRSRQIRFRDHTIVAGNYCRHLLRDIVLNLKHIGRSELIAIGLCPDDLAGLRIDQTGRDSQSVRVASDAAVQQIIDAEFPFEALGISRLFLELCGGFH